MASRITRRRQRRPDSISSPTAVRAVLDQLRQSLPEEITKSDKQLISMLRAARHIERYPATDTRRGRPSAYERAYLLQLATHLRAILARETEGRISLASFVDHYLRVLDFPSDIVDAIARGDINLFEAEQLARLTPQRLGVTPAKARRTRADLLSSHVQARLSGPRLHERVKELLGTAGTTLPVASRDPASADGLELEDFDPHDPTHLFYDEIKRLGFALKEITPADLTDDLLDEYLRASEPLWSVLAKIQKRKQPVRSVNLKV